MYGVSLMLWHDFLRSLVGNEGNFVFVFSSEPRESLLRPSQESETGEMEIQMRPKGGLY